MARAESAPFPEIDWHTIMGLDVDALNLAVERYCYPEHHWTLERRLQGPWRLEQPEKGEAILWASVPHLHHTASWERTMELVWRYRLSVICYQTHALLHSPSGIQELGAETEEEARLQLCRLAVWQAVQQQPEEQEDGESEEE